MFQKRSLGVGRPMTVQGLVPTALDEAKPPDHNEDPLRYASKLPGDDAVEDVPATSPEEK